MINLIVYQTNLYVRQKYVNTAFKTDRHEVMNIIGISLYMGVTILKKQVISKWRWKIDVDAGLVFILNIDTRPQIPEKRKVVRGEKRS